MNLETEMRKASPAGLANHVEKMLKAGQPLANICAALGVNATFVAKARRGAGLAKTQMGVATTGLFAHGGPDLMTKADDPIETSAPLRKSVRLSLGKGRPSSGTGATIANLIKKQVAEGSSYEQVHRLLNPDSEADGISLYAIKSVCEFGETLV